MTSAGLDSENMQLVDCVHTHQLPKKALQSGSKWLEVTNMGQDV
jgi:hypothetical protein